MLQCGPGVWMNPLLCLRLKAVLECSWFFFFQSTHEVVYEKYNNTIPKKIQRDLDNHDDVGPYVGFEAVGVAW